MKKALVGVALVLTAFLVFPVRAQRADRAAESSPEVFVPREPNDPLSRAKAHTELAALYFEDGELIVALEELVLAIAIHPEYAPAYSMRGVALYYLKEFESAEKDLETAIRLDPRDPEINNNYGWYLCQTGKERESIAYFENAHKSVVYKTPEQAFLNIGMCKARIDELDAAEEAINRSLTLSPNNPSAFFQLAIIHYKRKNYDAAKSFLDRIFQVVNAPGVDVLWLALRTEHRLDGRLAKERLAMQLRQRFPSSPEYRKYLEGRLE